MDHRLNLVELDVSMYIIVLELQYTFQCPSEGLTLEFCCCCCYFFFQASFHF